MSDITRKVEDLSIAIVMATPADLQALGDLYKKFNEISTIALNKSQDLVAKAAEAAGRLLEKIIMDEVPDRAAALDTISQTVSTMQAVVLNGRVTTFPQELGLMQAGKAGTGASAFPNGSDLGSPSARRAGEDPRTRRMRDLGSPSAREKARGKSPIPLRRRAVNRSLMRSRWTNV